jgi:hypothetical protein
LMALMDLMALQTDAWVGSPLSIIDASESHGMSCVKTPCSCLYYTKVRKYEKDHKAAVALARAKAAAEGVVGQKRKAEGEEGEPAVRQTGCSIG